MGCSGIVSMRDIVVSAVRKWRTISKIHGSIINTKKLKT